MDWVQSEIWKNCLNISEGFVFCRVFVKFGSITLYNVCLVHQGMFSTSGDTMSTSGGYHEYIRGIS